MRLIDADALIEFCAERWIPLNIDAVNMQPTIQPVATDTNVGDKISRQAAIDALDCISGVEEVLRSLPSAQPELIAQDAYIRGFEQGRTQGMIDSQGGKK